MKAYQEAPPAPVPAPTPTGAGPVPSFRQAMGFTSPSSSSVPEPSASPPQPKDDVPKLDVHMLTRSEIEQAKGLLKESAMFGKCTDSQVESVAHSMEKRTYNRGDNITVQDAPVDRFWVMASGYARRLREEEGSLRHVDSKTCGGTISSLSVIEGATTFATARCVTQQCSAYTLSRSEFLRMLQSDNSLQRGVLESLSARLRYKLHFRTPLFQQKSEHVNYTAVSIAAAIESYPRSALASILNRLLKPNLAPPPFFPSMHVQIPTRIMYISGFKGLRAFIDRNTDIDSLPSHPVRVIARFGTAVAPGVLMTPISSILEANNAGHANKEPLLRRSFRGTMPRGLREIIFGIGLNQMSDYFTERYRGIITSTALATSAGSITAGVVAGYLSHAPHNISTYKMMDPSLTYPQAFRQHVDASAPEKKVPRGIPDALRNPFRSVMACVFPRGLAVRTTQICVSFVILNGAIKLIERDQIRQLQSMAEAEEPGTETPVVAEQNANE